MTGKLNRAQRIIAFLEARYPGWVPAVELEPVGGRQGWRTAVSQARKILRQRENRWDEDDDPLPNRQRHVPANTEGGYWILSEYRIDKRCASSRAEDAVAGTGDEGTALPSREERDPVPPVERQGEPTADLNAWSLR